ncbi:YbaL family putative K(+) efflux transporter [Bartonella sp. TP]|uniref:YbaL family putative K(+) efflux transporter n=1 Tax=Bartonella sp. TP TaxID=3057550 RepID=UPI0025AF86D6|nr:YbaL family putative K(+) efflux transporter [Bartonella sp. TP]WJW79789.1 YbaL family putative K(+) efflux transporter [Bartonella sp. TP]
MASATPLITTISVGLCLAFLFGIVANKLKISPLVGYLLAGIIVGPYTGGFHADPELTHQLAEFGVILLMFGVGLHFSLKDLLSVRTIVIPGAILQILVSTLLGLLLACIMGWGMASGIVFGLALSTASTVVVLRNLQERRYIDSDAGRIAVGWLVVEDLVMVLALVLVPSLGTGLATKAHKYSDPLLSAFHLTITGVVALTIIKILLFIAVMLIIGRRLIPWLLELTAQTGSKELFRLSVLAIALGVAFAASEVFGVSLALGAFFAGMIMSETDLSQRAAEESLPLRDAFAVLFFVSVGMLLNPATIWHSFFPLLLTLLIILVGNATTAYILVRAFRYNIKTALTIAACLAQIGEFSFMLASLGNNLHLLNNLARDLIVGAAIISIIVNPLIFIATDKIKELLESKQPRDDIIPLDDTAEEELYLPQANFTDHIILIGFGAIGSILYSSLSKKGEQIVLIDESRRPTQLDNQNTIFIRGNGVNKEILLAANIANAKYLVLTMSHTFEAGQIIILAKQLNRNIYIVTDTKEASAARYMLDLGANKVVTDAQEIANGILKILQEKSTNKQLLVSDKRSESEN